MGDILCGVYMLLLLFFLSTPDEWKASVLQALSLLSSFHVDIPQGLPVNRSVVSNSVTVHNI